MLRLALLLLGLMSAAAPAAAQPTVSAVRIGDHGDRTRFVMELSEAPRYRVFTLSDPYRVVIDLSELQWAPGPDASSLSGGLISALRFGLFAPGTSRVVLDVSRPVVLQNAFLLPPRDGYPHRFVLDVAAVSPAEFAAAERNPPLLSDPPLAPVRTALPAAPRHPADRRITVVIDPGHGGVDPGALGVTGMHEKQIALEYGRELRRQLEATGRYRVVMTREEDIFLRLRDRIEIAQRQGGDLFISLHANNHASPRVAGASIYTLSENGSDSEAEALAAKENKADIIAGVDLSDQTEVVSKILIDLAQRETMNLSKRFANTLVTHVGDVTRLLGNTHRYAGFAVLKSPTVPSVLVEIGYLSNRDEERLLRSAKHRAAVTAAIVRAINAYFDRQESLNRS